MANIPKTRNTWPWKALGVPLPEKKPMPIRVKSTIQAAVMALVGFAIFRIWDHLIGPAIVWTLAALVLAGGWLYPPLFHGFERFGAKLAFWVSAGLTWGLLTPFFYITFTAGRLILWLSRKDPMDRAFPDAERASFWLPRPPVINMEQYKKQH
ncbi:MAG: hypothetical protein NZ740_00395 [Kiritimatiellae bacterium]|nr:hypothetical protein [Kiritimatiellia bacterium]MDW8457548.1 hypothetical protein [Verrucomicrobiota bacterium]